LVPGRDLNKGEAGQALAQTVFLSA